MNSVRPAMVASTRRARLDEDDDAPRLLEGAHKVLELVVAPQRTRIVAQLLARTCNALVGLVGGTVVHGDVEALGGDVECEVLAHDGEACEADAALGQRRRGGGCLLLLRRHGCEAVRL